MKYFTKEYVMGELDDAEFDQRLAQYLQYRATIWERLPTDLRKATNEVPFHDAKIESVDADDSAKIVRIELRCQRFEDKAARSVVLVYSDAELVDSGQRPAAKVAA